MYGVGGKYRCLSILIFKVFDFLVCISGFSCRASSVRIRCFFFGFNMLMMVVRSLGFDV